MKSSRFSEEQIIGILREVQGGGNTRSVCAAHNISEGTYYAWKRKYGGMDVSEARRLRALEDENARLKRIIADLSVQNHILKEVNAKKMVSPSARRRAARQSVESGLGSKAAACRALKLARSGFYRMARASVESRRIRKEIMELSAKHPRYGYRRVTALLRRDGFEVNPKRVARIRREEGLKVSKKQQRMKRLGVSTAQRARAERPRQVWSWDFVEDQTENGSRFRILTILDEHTRQCVAMHLGWSIRAVDVITVLEAAIARYGAPEHLRSDNGPEFIAYALQDWLEKASIKTIYITPGSPWEPSEARWPAVGSPQGEAKPRQNGHIESFHDKLRDECLNRELFGSLLEARVILEAWRIEYNESRPHSSLGYQTPGEFARRSNSGLRSPSGLPTPRVAMNTKTNHKQQPAELQI